MRVGKSAQKHGVCEIDVRHALRHTIRRVVMDDLTMNIGPAGDGTMLEIGMLDMEGDNPVVIHAMPLRPKFHRLLR